MPISCTWTSRIGPHRVALEEVFRETDELHWSVGLVVDLHRRRLGVGCGVDRRFQNFERTVEVLLDLLALQDDDRFRLHRNGAVQV
jgi:hypothetical protein